MNKILLFGAISVFSLSCSSSNDDNPFDNSDPTIQNVVLPVKVTNEGVTMKVNYNGTKIISLISTTSPGFRIEFSYTDDYITNIKHYYNNILDTSIDYTYSSGRLATAVNKEYSDSGVIQATVTYTYTHVSTTQINVKKQAILGPNTNYTMNNVYMYNSNGNMVSSTGTGTGVTSGNSVNYTQNGTYIHTEKNYAFKNVKGLDKIIFNGDTDDNVSILFSNIKNSLGTFKSSIVSTTAGGTGNVFLNYKYTTTFNPTGYPSIESRQELDSSGNPTATPPDQFIYEYNYQ